MPLRGRLRILTFVLENLAEIARFGAESGAVSLFAHALDEALEAAKSDRDDLNRTRDLATVAQGYKMIGRLAPPITIFAQN